MIGDQASGKRVVYEIRVKGVLHGEWRNWFDGMEVSPQPGGETLLTGPIADQAALHGLLLKIRDVGMPLLSVRRVYGKDRSDPQLGGE
jgi:hypothetical protein